MAHTRDFRRVAYWTAVRKALEGELASAESPADLDQVAYRPDRLVLSPSPRESIDAGIDPALESDVRTILARSDLKAGDPWEPVRWTGAERKVYLVPNDIGGDAYSISAELDRTYPQQIAPVYYAITQQHAQPGEDPEDGVYALGLPFDTSASASGSSLGSGVRIAVIDTGIDENAINASGLPNQQFDAHDIDPLTDLTDPAFLGPSGGHGTFIASLITSIAPGAVVRSYRVANPMGVADEESIADGIHRALTDGTDVINISLGGYPFVKNAAWPTLPEFTILAAAINAIPDNIAVVAAAGNCGSSAPFYPAAFPGVIGVAALDPNGQLWENSNHGRWVRACARGVKLRALFVRGAENPAYDADGSAERFEREVNVASWTGTSFAAPVVAAQIAILASATNMGNDTRRAAEILLAMSRAHADERGCGRRILVDLPGQS